MKNNIVLATLYGYISGIFGIAVTFLSVPLVLQILGQTQYGFYIIINSISQYLSISKFGFSSALQNKISILYSEDKTDEINSYVSTFFYLFAGCFIGLTILLSSIIFFDFVSFSFLFKDKDFITLTEKYIIIIIIINTLLNLFMNSIISDILKGLNEVSLNSKIMMTFSFFSSLNYLIFIYFYAASLLDIVLFNLVLTFLQFVYKFYIIKRKIIFITFNFSIRTSNIVDIKTTSFYFFCVSIVSIALGTLDKIYISSLIGANEVFMYYLLYKIYQVPLKLGSFDDQSWPTFTTLYNKKDINSIEKLFEFLIRMNMITKIIPMLIIFIFSSHIIELWTATVDSFYDYQVSLILFLIFVLGSVFRTSMVYINATTNQKGNFIIQVITTIVFSLFVFLFYYIVDDFSLVYIPLSYLFAQLLYVYFIFYIKKDININFLLLCSKIYLNFSPFILFLICIFFVKEYFNIYFLIILVCSLYCIYIYMFGLEKCERKKFKRKFFK